MSMLGLRCPLLICCLAQLPRAVFAPVLPDWGTPEAGQALCLEGVILGGQRKALLLGSVARGLWQAEC